MSVCISRRLRSLSVPRESALVVGAAAPASQRVVSPTSTEPTLPAASDLHQCHLLTPTPAPLCAEHSHSVTLSVSCSEQ